MGTTRSSLKEGIIDDWGSRAMDQIAFTPPIIVDLAEVAILLGFCSLAQLLVDAAYALASEDIKLDEIETTFKDLGCALLVIRGPEGSERQVMSHGIRNGDHSDKSTAFGILAKAERKLRMEIILARQAIF